MAFSEAHVPLKFRLYRLLVAIGLLVGWISCCSPGSNSHERRIRPPFVLGQRRPDLHENAGMASGEPQGPISRNSEKFRSQLVRSFDTGIVFRDDENTGADRVMSRRCKSALERLAQLVKDEWEGTVKLRVIDAWDEDGEHTANSLHYEGRALDITTSDLDTSKYGKLASLAFYGAHFDWVQYQTKHVHVSCRTDAPEDQTNQCFPAQGLVRLPNDEVKRLEDLKVGDRVLAINDQGTLTFSDITMFLDRQPHVEMVNYISIQTSDPPRQLSLTENHLLYISKTSNSSASVQYARQVRTGDFVHVLVPGNERLCTARVTLVQRHRLRGAIAPLTSEGTIVVNDVLSSCYANMRDQSFAHWTFLPWRQIYTVVGGMLSPNNQTGVHWYPNILRTMNYLLGLYPQI